MRKKLFTFLLALVASVGMMNAKVTWNSSNISDLNISGTGGAYSKEGVTLSVNADNNEAYWYGYGDESKRGILFYIDATGGYTFSNTLGKNFTKIEMFPTSHTGWAGVNLGSGWLFSGEDGDPVTWTGNASTVDLLNDVSQFNGENVKSIVFYFEGDSEEPATPTVYNSGSVALSNLNVGDILMAGVTVTSEKADYRITLAANRLKFMNSVRSSDLTTQFSSINPVLGENAVILTSTAAIFYTPIDEDGNTGNAWEVTANEVGTKVTLAGITYSGTTPASSDEGASGALPGKFSVSASQVVYFSKGNLQATTSDQGATWTWGFAENQWGYVGNAAANNAINGGGTVSSNGPVDLFAWSSTDNNYFGINNSINEADYSGDFKDWGAKKGSDWRTLTINEWQYLLQERNPGSSSANHTNYPRYTNAQILTDGTAPQKDIKGIILFPDDFNDGGESIDGVTWGSINPSFYSSYPTYCTTAGWATLESMGCVFLPSAGSRQNFGDEFAILDVNLMGNYWSSTLNSGEPEDPQSIAVGNGTLGIGTNPRYFGMSVRLVSETAPGGSAPATGLQVVEVTSELYDGWNSNSNPFSVNALPGFQAVTFDEAKEWTGVPTSGTAVLVYRTNGDYARVIQFFDGTITGDYDIETDFNQIYENITIFGNRYFYTAGGSNPAVDPAESVTVVFEANNNQKEVEVTLPHTFACDFENGNGELDGIIQELYALQYGGYCPAFNVPTATGNEAVTASKDGNNHYIAISEAFEGTATVTGNYIKYLDTEHMGNTSVDYTLTISVHGSTPTPTPSATSGIFAYNYDCSRSPAYPSKGNSCTLSSFKAPCVGLNGIGTDLNPKNVTQGPWKVEFYEMYDDDHASTYGDLWEARFNAWQILLEYYGGSVVPDYSDDLSAFAAYAHEKLPVYTLSQWNGSAYQVVGYGFICAYAGEGNVVEHAALFIEAGNDYGCFLSGHEHSANLDLTFDYDLKDDMTSFFAAGGGSTPAVDPAVQNVIDLINAIPNPVVYNQECYNALEAAHNAYVALTEEQRDQVTNYNDYLEAEEMYYMLADVNYVIEKINEIGNVEFTPACKHRIDYARSEYCNLTLEQKGYVTNYNTLLAAEAAYAALIPVSSTVEWDEAILETIDADEWGEATYTNGSISLKAVDGRAYYVDDEQHFLFDGSNSEKSFVFSCTSANMLRIEIEVSEKHEHNELSCAWQETATGYRWVGEATSVDLASTISKVTGIRFSLGEAFPEPTPTPAQDGDKLPGAFSVDGGKVVYFSKGNLQYLGNIDRWHFAENQWTIIGDAQASNNRDLFSWGTGDNPDSEDYSTYTEWGDNIEGNWRTLTVDEWTYLFNTRTGASSKYGTATVAGVVGLILLPDVYDGTAINTERTAWDNNVISGSEWAAYEAAGAVFLPAAGLSDAFGVYGVGVQGFYWSSTMDALSHYAISVFYGIDPHEGYWFNQVDAQFQPQEGHSVRLVSETAPSGGSTPANPEVGMKGSWDDWADVVNFTDNGDGTASVAKSFEHEGYYTFKTVLDGDDWRGNGYTYKRSYTGAEGITENDGDMTVWIDAKGEYTFTWTYATNAINISYPTLPTIHTKGSWDNWTDALDFTDNGDGTASATKNFDAEGYHTFKVNVGTDDWRGNGETFKRDYTGANWINENGSDMKLYVDEPGDYTFTWNYVENALSIAFPAQTTHDVPTNEDPQNPSYHYSTFYHSANKYELPANVEAFVADLSDNNLILTRIAVTGQTIPSNTAVILRRTGSNEDIQLIPSDAEAVTFTSHNSLQGRDMLTPIEELGLTRATCYVLSGADNVVGFYKINSDYLKAHKAYVKYVGLQQNAPRRMRFVFNTTTGVEAVTGYGLQVTGQKLIENGQLIIIKNGVRYNAQGQIVK